ncbi:hypothetical protein AVEN_88099-1 [Araneus ventricosus]|uniref:Metalloendopeptidase n=1 Tax=Araneus ventricosus TaxID=182803 RepID=A0A4Y2CYB0_ARAVE|nr:hypothetical protein AVEN_88099-1 [Araneus ventricosus]
MISCVRPCTSRARTNFPSPPFTGSLHNFDKTKPIDELKLVKYDYTSIMHYGEYAFSKEPGKLKTMKAKDGKTTIEDPYDKPGLTDNDIDLVKKLYKCK